MTSMDNAFSDEELTAFLDGEADDELAAKITEAARADAALAARLDDLDAPMADLRTAFDLKALAAPEMPADLALAPEAAGFSWGLPLALAASFALGMLSMNLLRPATAGWVDQVASYQALYVEETLAAPQQSPEVTRAALTMAQNAMGFEVADVPQLPGMVFKRAQMLAIEGAPLIQLAYLAEDGTPFAFCITKVSDADRPLSTEQSFDLATGSWVRDGLGFVLIGGADEALITDLAISLSAEI